MNDLTSFQQLVLDACDEELFHTVARITARAYTSNIFDTQSKRAATLRALQILHAKGLVEWTSYTKFGTTGLYKRKARSLPMLVCANCGKPAKTSNGWRCFHCGIDHSEQDAVIEETRSYD